MHKGLAAAGAAIVLAVAPLTGCYMAEPQTGVQSDGTYRVIDLASHLEMCENMTTEAERPVCIETAYETWEK